MGLKTPSFTLKESLVVLDEALRLIRTPERWTTGKWKCPVFATDTKGQRIRDYESRYGYKQKTDKDGRPMYAYCIEGAVNQAVINKFGPIRAEQVGALRAGACPIGEEWDFISEDLDTGEPGPTDLISVNDIVTELYGTEYGYIKGERNALSMNDSSAADKATTYERIITALKTRRERIAEALAEKFPNAA